MPDVLLVGGVTVDAIAYTAPALVNFDPPTCADLIGHGYAIAAHPHIIANCGNVARWDHQRIRAGRNVSGRSDSAATEAPGSCVNSSMPVTIYLLSSVSIDAVTYASGVVITLDAATAIDLTSNHLATTGLRAIEAAISKGAPQFDHGQMVRRRGISGRSQGTPTPAPGTLLSPPVALGWTPPVNVYRSGSGTASTFSTDYDPAAARAAWESAYPGFTTWYVDGVTGNNNNDGASAATPVRSIDLAMKMGQDTGAAFKVIVGSGSKAAPKQYKYNATQARSGQATNNATWRDSWCSVVVTVPCMVIPDTAGGRFDNINLASGISFTTTTDANIFKAVNGTNLVDFSSRSRLGGGRPLVPLILTPADANNPWPEINTEATRLSALNDGTGDNYGVGVYWRDTSANTYVRLWDGRNPTSSLNTNLFGADNSNCSNTLRPTGAFSYYFEGANMLAGKTGAINILAPSGFRPNLQCVDCTFVGGTAIGVLMTDGAATTDGVDSILVRCEASGGGLDGFNYHSSNRSVEIDCEAYWNGREFAGSEGFANNGTTQHETAAALRVNGRYLYSQDRSVHDVGTSKSWNLGCVAGTRRAAAGGAGGADGASSMAWCCGHPNGSVTRMWMDACAVRAGPWGAAHYPIACYASATLNYANMDAPTGNPGAGTIQPYTP